jgi:hypothetical protein
MNPDRFVSSSAVVAQDDRVRLTATVQGEALVLDFLITDADAVGCVLKAVADEMRGRTDAVQRMRADRDALDVALAILDEPAQMELAA